MDTFKDKQRLEDLNNTNPPWKVWTRCPADAAPVSAAKVA
jgi:glucose-1-phosphate cytidylyltransferase